MSDELFEELRTACSLKQTSYARDLLGQYPQLINKQDPLTGQTCLHQAVISDDHEITTLLLELKADPDSSAFNKETPLHQAAKQGSLPLTELLLQFGASPQAITCDGNSPLHYAAAQGDVQVVGCLLLHKAEPNLRNSGQGRTPLHLAVQHDHIEAARCLIEFGGSGTLEDSSSVTPANLASSPEMSALFCELRSIESIPPIPDLGFLPSALPPSNTNSETSLSNTRACSLEMTEYNQRIRDSVKLSILSMKKSHHRTLSSIQELEARRVLFPKKERTNSLGNSEKQTELHNWLVTYHLEHLFELLLDAGYDDLEQMAAQMNSPDPLNEASLERIGIHKIGLQQRLLAGLFEESQAKRTPPSAVRSPQFWQCCSAKPAADLEVKILQTLSMWLQGLGLDYAYPLFLQAGYEDLEQLLGLMHTPWHISTNTLKKIGILSERDCKLLVNALHRECGTAKSLRKPYALLSTRRAPPTKERSNCLMM